MDGKRRIWLTVVSGVGLLAGLLAFALYALLGGYTGGRTFGAVYMTMSAPYYEILSDELRAAVEERGGRLLSRDPEGDPDLQVQEIYDLIGQKVDGLFLDVLNTPAVDAAVDAARAAGIPVVALDTPRADSRMADCTVTSDNHMLGAQCARDLLSRRTSARVLVLSQNDSVSMAQRVSGFARTLKTRENYAVVRTIRCDDSMSAARAETLAAIDGGLEFDAVFAVSDEMAIGAMTALTERERLDSVLTYGVNGSPDARLLIDEGLMAGTAAQRPGVLARSAAACMYELLEGRRPEAQYRIEGVMIHRDNVGQFGLNDWQ